MRTVEEAELRRPVIDYAVRVDTVISQNFTIEEALRSLRQKKSGSQKSIYFYVVDDQYRLKGVVSTRQLLLSAPHIKIGDVMQDWVAKLKIDHTIKDAMELFEQHPLLALPIVDHDGKLMGAVDVQMMTKEAMDLADIHSRMAVFQMIGVTLEDGKKFPLFHSFLLRMPWLFCNVFSGLVCALISLHFERVVSEFLVLAFFVPMVLTLTESISMQSMAQSMQFLRRPRFSWKIVKLKSFQEWQAVWLLAICFGSLVSGISFFWEHHLKLSLIIGVGVFFSILCSAIFGMLLPVVLNQMKLDPKVASGPVVLMIADMLTMTIYLSIATSLLL